MKNIIAIVLIMLSLSSYGTECLDAPHTQDPVEHFSKASDVLYGRVTQGKYFEDENRRYISFSFEIFKSLKGGMSGTINIESWLYDTFGIGQSYIIFLYGGTDIKPCAKIVTLFPGMKTMEELYFQSRRSDIEFAHETKQILQQAGYKP